MKRVLVFMLSLALVLGMTTVAYGASRTKFISVVDTPYLFRDGEMVAADEFIPGKTYYFPIENLDSDYSDSSNIRTRSAVSGLRVTRDLISGSNVFDSVSIVQRKAIGLSDLGFDEDDNTLFISVSTKATESVRPVTVDFAFTLGADSSVEIGNSTATLYQTFEYDSTEVVGDDFSVGSDYVYNFDDITGKVTLDFPGGASYTVYVSSQKERYLDYTTDPFDSASATQIFKAYASTDAQMDFYLFLGKTSEKTFDATGKLYLPAGEGEYLYQIIDGRISKVDATYSRDDLGFIIRTKTPGSYVISDRRLSGIADDTGDDSSSSTSSASASDDPSENISLPVGPTNGVQVNPDTGSNDFVGIAMSLAVVSLACIGIFTFKKRVQ